MIRSTLAVLLAVNGVVGSALTERAGCTDVHIFVTRGNDEPYPGRQGALTDKICSHFTSCDAEHIEYDNPAAPACDALTKGPALAIAQVNAYVQRCPNSQIVLTGYSQGGQTMGDILGGGGGQFWDCQEPNNAGYDPNSGTGSKIVAALLWGDARHTANQPYNVQSGSGKDGYFPRSGGQLSSLGKWSDRLRSYCVDTDPICARGNDGHTHETYFDVFGDDAASWVASKVRKSNSLTSAQSSAASTPSVSASAGSSAASVSSVASTSASASGSASASASGSASGSASSGASSSQTTGSVSSTVVVDAQGASTGTPIAISDAYSVTQAFSAGGYGYGSSYTASTTSAIPYQATNSAPYFYPVMASNTVAPGTTYSTAPTSVPASAFLTLISATVTGSTPSASVGGNGTYGSATPSVTPYKGAGAVTKISGAIIVVALGAIAAL